MVGKIQVDARSQNTMYSRGSSVTKLGPFNHDITVKTFGNESFKGPIVNAINCCKGGLTLWEPFVSGPFVRDDSLLEFTQALDISVY